MLSIDDVELRAAIIETHGWDLVLEKAMLIDEYITTARGSEKIPDFETFYANSEGCLPVTYRLYDLAEFPVHLLYGEWCERGVLRSFVETMPKDIMTCRATVAWSFGLSETEYWDGLVT